VTHVIYSKLKSSTSQFKH